MQEPKLYLVGKKGCGACGEIRAKWAANRTRAQYITLGPVYESIMDATCAQYYPFAAVCDTDSAGRFRLPEYYPEMSGEVIEQLENRFREG